jgi:hypothetical protein
MLIDYKKHVSLTVTGLIFLISISLLVTLFMEHPFFLLVPLAIAISYVMGLVIKIFLREFFFTVEEYNVSKLEYKCAINDETWYDESYETAKISMQKNFYKEQRLYIKYINNYGSLKIERIDQIRFDRIKQLKRTIKLQEDTNKILA